MSEEERELVGIEVIPVGKTADRCEGAIVRLVRGEGATDESSLAAGLGPEQCREIARQLLTIADAASGGAERTLMCVSASTMWALPGQALIVRCTPDPHFEFAVDPTRHQSQVRRPRKELLLANGLPASVLRQGR